MEKLVTSNLKLGIIAGGQLGKMLIQEASKWDIFTFVMDKDENCPAGEIASFFKKGDNQCFDDVYNFGKGLDVVTYEIENINIEALKRLKAEGVRVLPDPAILEMIQDKGLQKNFYKENHIPSSAYSLYGSKEEVMHAIENGMIHYPFVQKLRKGGYDGRGVMIIRTAEEIDKMLNGPSVIESMVEIDKEIAVIVARNGKGDIRTFPSVEMVFDPMANLVDQLICPANISINTEEEAQSIARQIVEKMKFTGILAIEFFINKNGEVLVNEVAPRPHNSGHHTIESVITSQYEQHLRAILNLPLGSTHLKMPSVMINLLGEKGHKGPVKYEGLTESMGIDGVKIHVYGKKITWPMRKMGHVTVMSETIEKAIEKAQKVKELIKVKSWKGNQ